jgi:hypothetical protein
MIVRISVGSLITAITDILFPQDGTAERALAVCSAPSCRKRCGLPAARGDVERQLGDEVQASRRLRGKRLPSEGQRNGAPYL